MILNLRKVGGGLVGATEADIEYINKLKHNQVLSADFKKKRNSAFFRKWWALIDFAYEHWEPDLPDHKLNPEKTFDRFRKDLTILAGYYTAEYRINGDVRIEAKSISFAKMEEEEFEQLYSNTINAILKHILKNYTYADLDNVVNELLRFD
jgi:hypothetical protein